MFVGHLHVFGEISVLVFHSCFNWIFLNWVVVFLILSCNFVVV